MSRKRAVASTLPPRTGEARRLHAMPDRCRVSRFDRLRQKWWAVRTRIGMRVRGKL